MEVSGARIASFSPVGRELDIVSSEAPGIPRHRAHGATRARGEGYPYRLIPLVAWTLAVVVGEIVAWFLVRSQGNVIAGDSPHYLIAAQSLSHFTLDVVPAYARDMVSRAVYDWPIGTTVRTPYAIHAYLPGPHGPVFAQGIGLPALLAPFMALGSVPFALIGFFTVDAAGMVLLHQRASRLAGIGKGGRALFALVMAAPALWLAATQVYPDLVSGIFLACGFVELAILERNGRLDRLGTAVLIVSFGTVPWFHIKNAIPAFVGVVAFIIIGSRRDLDRARLIALTGVVLASFAALVAYNQFYFSHLLGLPQPTPTFDSGSAWRVVALGFDRDQGLFIQVPTVLLGVVGLWFARKRSGVCALALVVAVGAVLVINGTYPSPPLGGVSFAGRFQWTVLPMLLAWSALFIGRLQAVPRRLLLVGVTVGGLWTIQLVPILLGHHVYSNEWYVPFRPWDPAIYPGWWPLADRFLPTFAYPSMHMTGMVGRLFLIVGVLAAVVWLLVRLCRPDPIRPLPIVVVSGAIVLFVSAVAIFGPVNTLPARPQTWAGADLGSPWAPGDISYRYPPIELLDIGRGSYEGVFTYKLTESSLPSPTISLLVTPSKRAMVSKWLIWRHPTDASPMIVVTAPLDIRQGVASTVSLGTVASSGQSATFHLSVTRQSTLSFEVHLSAHSELDAKTLRLEKVSNQPGRPG
jgi:hypothetical protein